MISKEEVKKIADLARLELTDSEIENYQKDLSKILDYVEKIQKADVSGVEASLSFFGNKNVMREDKPGVIEPENSQYLIEAAPDEKNGFVKVKPVF